MTLLLWILILAAAPSTGQTVDPALEKDILRLMEVTGSAKIAEQMATFVSREMINMLGETQPNVPQRALDITNEVVQAKLASAMNASGGLVSQMVGVYAKHFTHGEIRGLLAFYETELGRKTIAVMPALLQEGMQVGQEWGKAIMPDVETELLSRLKKEGFIK